MASAKCLASSSSPASVRVQPHCRLPQQLPPSTGRYHQRQLVGVVVRVNSRDKSPTTTATTSSSEVDAEEARIEAIEAASKKARGKTAARRQIPIRNMTPREESSSSNRAEWKKGQLFPEGWEQMSLPEKVAELYLGQRGMLFWATELSWKAAIALGVAWVLFRVGGAVGLYQLQGDLTMPPM